MSRRALFAVGLVALGVGWLASRPLSNRGDIWRPVARGEIVLSVPTQGRLRAVRSLVIGPPRVPRIWNFQISMIGPDGGQVAAGDPILGFDSTDLKSRLRRASTAVDSAAAELEKVNSDLAIRDRQLALQLQEAQGRFSRAELAASVDRRVIALRDHRKARLDLLLARYEIEYVEALIRQQVIKREKSLESLRSRMATQERTVVQLRDAIGKMTVRAPQAGTLIISSDWEGKTRQVGDQAWPSDQILELPDLTNMEALAEVDEIAAGRLRLGQSVSLRLDAYSEREYSGRVSRIRRVVQKRSADDPTKVMRLTVSIAATDAERMRPGMRFTGVITTDVIADVLSIPRQAVSSDASGAFVILKTAVGHKKVYPDFGQANQQLVAVVSGLQRGDLVLIQNPRVTTASGEK